MPDTTRLTTALGDRYLIERELGSGGMATVYLAKDLKHERDVALKVLRPELGAVLGPDRFLAEIKITARLDHPHILTLIDSGASDGFLYYVLPFVRGESLRDKLNRDKQLGIEEALAITRQIASALDYAHRSGVVHRDIKPENILIQEGEAMLADFGIALAVKEAGGNRLTETGLSLGTPQYMSPEQATGDRTLDARSDVYSLAAVLYEMLTGEPPVTGATAQAMIAKLMTERPTRVRTVRDTVPEGIDNAIAKALSKVPADRQGSAGEFAGSLSAAVDRAPGPGGPERPMARVGFAAVAVLALVAIGGLLLRGRGSVRVILPDRQQITFTGNARTPGLSPDGQRLAYSARQCNAEGDCTVDVVVQDVGGAGVSTVLRGFASIWQIAWAPDGRYLVVDGYQGGDGKWGPFSVPSLGGGAPRFLGCCVAKLLAGDTVLVSRSAYGDSIGWILKVTLSDAMVRDSLPVRLSAQSNMSAASLGRGRFLVIHREPGSQLLQVMSADGHIVDSTRLNDSRLFPDEPYPDGGGVLIQQIGETRTGQVNVLGLRIDDRGRFATRLDTILRQLDGEFTVAANGALLTTFGPSEYEVWLLRRDASTSMRFTQRRLAAATVPMGGGISRDGARVVLWRRVIQGGKALTQVTMMPPDSGPEPPLGPPLDLADFDLTSDGTGLLLAVRREDDSVDLRVRELSSGTVRPLASVSFRDVAALYPLPGGGVALSSVSGTTIRLVGIPGRRDTVFAYPEADGVLQSLDPSPDGREAVTVGWDRNGDSIVVRRVSLIDGHAVQLAAFYADGSQRPYWLPGGTLLLQIRETASTWVWYRMPVTGGRPVRTGTPPRSADGTFRLSSDGRRVLARVTINRPDVYVIRNFAEILRH